VGAVSSLGLESDILPRLAGRCSLYICFPISYPVNDQSLNHPGDRGNSGVQGQANVLFIFQFLHFRNEFGDGSTL
jgi:hypothetical protein